MAAALPAAAQQQFPLPPELEPKIIAWEAARKANAKPLLPCPSAPNGILAGRIIARMQAEQQLRDQHPSSHPKVLAEDRQNSRFLSVLIANHGFPHRCLVGDKGAEAAVLILQHTQNMDLRRMATALAEAETIAGRLAPQHLPLLADRLAILQAQPQRFGTQARCNETAGRHEPLPISDLAGVDKRRAEAGLLPLQWYLTVLDSAYPCKPAS